VIHRTHLGGLLAVLLPGALWIHPLLAIPLAVGLWKIRAWTAWLACVVGLAMLWPRSLILTGWLAMLVAALSWDSWTMNRLRVRSRDTVADRWLPHGAGLDGLRARLISWAYLLRTWSWRGGDPRLALEAAHIRSGGLAMEGDPARNEFFQVGYHYGLAGVIGLAGLAALVAARLHVGDPVSATLVTGGVVLSGTAPLTALRRWLTGGDGPLFGPPLRASLTIHLDASGQVHLYGADAADRALQIEIARAFANVFDGWIRQHHLSTEEVQGR
jgi:hypothetical protein